MSEKTSKVETDVAVQQQNESMLATQNQAPMGFEEEEEGDMIIPRVKVIQTLSPERKDKLAVEGDIINSLTKEKLNGKVFIPVFKFNSNILWKDRSAGGGIECQARDGKNATASDGTQLLCKICKKCEFDNTKTGKAAIPTCTKYINFFGFISGQPIPIIVSFAKTNYNEGKKLYSLAKVTMQNMWNHGYVLNEKLVSKNGNEWYIINVAANGATTAEERALGMQLYTNFRNTDLKYDVDDASTEESGMSVEQANSTEF